MAGSVIAEKRAGAAAPGATSALSCWCGRGSWRRCFRTPRFGLVRCSACGSYRIDPPPIDSEAESAPFYTDYYEKGIPIEEVTPSEPHLTRTGRRDSRFWGVVLRVPSLEAAGDRVLDIGCGEGGLCSELKAAGWQRVLGLDVSRSRVARARAKHPGVEFFDRPLAETGIEEGSLDMIIMDNVIEHLPDPAALLRSAWARLKPGGTLVIITPNMESGCFRLLGRRWTPELSPHAHIFLFIPSAIRELLTTSGYRVDHEGTLCGHYSRRDLLDPWLARKWKLAVWRLVQDAGLRYSELINSGPMLYAVAHRPVGAETEIPVGTTRARSAASASFRSAD